MGISIFNAGSETSIPIFAKYFKSLGKVTIAVFDKQSDSVNLDNIKSNTDYFYESSYKGFEDLILSETDITILISFVQDLIDKNEWPTHITVDEDLTSMAYEKFINLLSKYLRWQKASGSASDIISLCDLQQFPNTLSSVIQDITNNFK